MEKHVIGLDIGGTKITAIVFDGRKQIKGLTVLTPKKMAVFKSRLKELVEFLAADQAILGIGIGVAGIIDSKRGIVEYSPNLKFINGFNFVEFFAGTKIKIQVDNDAKCFALAEARFGQGRRFKNFMGLTLGTGIGGGIIMDGQVYRGAHGSAGEVGHMLADSFKTFEQRFQKARDRKDYLKLGKMIGALCADIINLLDVEALILGGTVAKKYHRQFLPRALKEAKQHLLNKKIKPRVLVSKLDNAGALGAALLI